ncbi:OTU domain-containing protein 1-like isoform X2 [Mercenaria mercenaria]|nr:OTU domain-containing protein 1-like isoform X2 [Mercenaria mercenaria]
MNPSSSLGLISVEMFNQDEHLRSRGLTRQNMDKDGNCLFRAISFGLYHTQDMYAELRSQAIGYIRDHYDAFRDFFIPSSGQSPSDFMQDELHRLEQDGVYAGYECIAALGQLFNIHFEVFLGGHPENPRVTSIHFGQSGQHSIFLIYSSLGGGHYDAGIEIERSVSNPGNNIPQPESLVTPNNIDIDYASSVDQLVAEVPFVEHEHLDVNSSISATAHVKEVGYLVSRVNSN